MAIAQAIVLISALKRREGNALRLSRPIARAPHLEGAFAHRTRKDRRLGQRIYQTPFNRLLAAHPFSSGAKNIGQVVAHMALVGQARESAGAGQHTQQRHFGQRHRRRPVVDQQDLIAGQRQLIAATGAGAVDRGQKPQPRVAAAVFDAVAGLIGELAEIDLPGMTRDTKHEDIGARTEDALFQAGDHHGANRRMLEADAVECVMQFDVDAEVVAVELELVTRAQAGGLVDIHRQSGDGPVNAQRSVVDAGKLGGKRSIHGRSPGNRSATANMQDRSLLSALNRCIILLNSAMSIEEKHYIADYATSSCPIASRKPSRSRVKASSSVRPLVSICRSARA